jgi:hypothetical protein
MTELGWPTSESTQEHLKNLVSQGYITAAEGMWIAALHHTKMVEELAVLWAAVSSTVELALGRSPVETFRVEVVGELVDEFGKLEERRC